MLRIASALAAALFLGVGIAGCGNDGPLVIPPAQSAGSSAKPAAGPKSTPAQQPATSGDTQERDNPGEDSADDPADDHRKPTDDH